MLIKSLGLQAGEGEEGVKSTSTHHRQRGADGHEEAEEAKGSASDSVHS